MMKPRSKAEAKATLLKWKVQGSAEIESPFYLLGVLESTLESTSLTPSGRIAEAKAYMNAWQEIRYAKPADEDDEEEAMTEEDIRNEIDWGYGQ